MHALSNNLQNYMLFKIKFEAQNTPIEIVTCVNNVNYFQKLQFY